MVGVDDSSLQVVWLALRVGGHLVLFFFHQINLVNFCKNFFIEATSCLENVEDLEMLGVLTAVGEIPGN